MPGLSSVADGFPSGQCRAGAMASPVHQKLPCWEARTRHFPARALGREKVCGGNGWLAEAKADETET